MPVLTRHAAVTTASRANAGLGVLATIAIAISTVALLRPQADASAVVKAAPTSMATVDLVAVITQLDEFKVIDKRIQADVDKKSNEIKQLSEEIDGLTADMERLDPNTDAYDQIFRERNMKMGFRELRGSMLVKWQQEDTARVLTELYEKALKAVEEVARRDGWEAVIHGGQPLMVPRNPNVRAENAVDFVENFIQTRRVIYAGDSVNITNSVVQHMNNKYAAGG
ncbi:MAG: OmpH family outer membrane protein [Phycisphaerales bacterium JB060]